MSAKPQPITGPPPGPTGQQFMTAEDAEAQFASVLWYEAQNAAGKLPDYHEHFVAILGERIIDTDPDESELNRRLDALGDTIPQFQVVVRYRGSVEHPH
ncbi:MAG: hypothetical protein JWO38_102 [Gemmataceae bacterium]|nr:hypothetical protein [Gemmataceae bacterium]